MSINFKKTYKFAVKSALYIALFSSGFVTILTYFFFTINWIFSVFFGVSIFVFSFFVLQYRVEHFIYRRVKKIYDDISFLDSSEFRSQPITTDMATLTKQVKKFATDKKLEIEMLKDREEYRREFLGNVSHELKTPLFTVQGYMVRIKTKF
jgi:two-component system phosphate regulon sensor histidine kinase PhoR